MNQIKITVERIVKGLPKQKQDYRDRGSMCFRNTTVRYQCGGHVNHDYNVQEFWDTIWRQNLAIYAVEEGAEMNTEDSENESHEITMNFPRLEKTIDTEMQEAIENNLS